MEAVDAVVDEDEAAADLVLPPPQPAAMNAKTERNVTTITDLALRGEGLEPEAFIT